jgi:hypothetical protein
VADVRELILARLAVVCGAVSGVSAVARNRLDVPALARPAVIIQDAIEALLDAPQGPRHGELQRIELSPGITVVLRGGGTTEPGALLSLYRSRIVHAVLSDSELQMLTTSNGRIRYEGCLVAQPDAEGKEYRLDLTIVFTYPFRLGDLAP